MKHAALLLALGLGAACSASEHPGDAGQAGQRPERAEHNHAKHDHAVEGGHEGHETSTQLRGVLLREDDLPDGYRQGDAHHQATPGAPSAPRLDSACAPLGELVGTHPSVRQDQHPEASVSFSKGHFGPQITETVIDYGEAGAAVAALADVRRAGADCDRYLQSTSPIGANRYAVGPATGIADVTGGTALRLDALGSDFDGIYWDVWATASEGRLVAVSFRSARGGDNDDLTGAVEAAMTRIGRV
ncbi:MAG: hypothetical protein ACRDO7_09610 [Nocardioidaceae bacterium]